MNKAQVAAAAKITALAYMTVFLTLNWMDVSWLFNYRATTGLIGDFFTPYPAVQTAAADPVFYPNRTETKSAAKFENSEKNNLLEIPKIGISAPIIFSQEKDTKSLLKDLDKGVIYYPGSVYPGQEGQIVILGHSSPQGWPKIKYDWIFSEIDNLEQGDQIILHINNKKYIYSVKQKNILKKGEEINSANLRQNGNFLALVSCWPPGKDLQRITVQAELDN